MLSTNRWLTDCINHQHRSVCQDLVSYETPYSLSLPFRPSRNQILRQCKYLIRKLEYEEIARADPMRALGYLQSRLNEIINHEDGKEVRELYKLASLLFKPVDGPGDTDRLITVVSPLMLGNPSSPDTSSMDDDDTSSCSGPATADPIPSSSVKQEKVVDGKSNGAAALPSAEQEIMIKSQRCLLFNRLVELMPDQILCQPKGNLSDLVLI